MCIRDRQVLNWMNSKSKEELKAIWKCNDKIAEQNFNRLENMDLYNRLTPAVLACKATWGMAKALLFIIGLPVILIGLLIAGFISLAAPLLIITLIAVFIWSFAKQY